MWVLSNVLTLWVRHKVAEKRFTVVGENRERSDVVGSMQKPITVERFEQSSLGKSETFYRGGGNPRRGNLFSEALFLQHFVLTPWGLCAQTRYVETFWGNPRRWNVSEK